jgi:hypothetical protein
MLDKPLPRSLPAILEAIEQLSPDEREALIEHLTIAKVEEARQKARKLWRSALMSRILLLQILQISAKEQKRRNRQSDPETVAKDAEIYERRHEDPRKWPWKRLAGHFDYDTKAGARAAYLRHESRLLQPPDTIKAHVEELGARLDRVYPHFREKAVELIRAHREKVSELVRTPVPPAQSRVKFKNELGD